MKQIIKRCMTEAEELQSEKYLDMNPNQYFQLRHFEIKYYSAEANGRSYYPVKCPFCDGSINLQAWSARTSGKKCDGCGAVLRQMYTGGGYAMLKMKDAKRAGFLELESKGK